MIAFGASPSKADKRDLKDYGVQAMPFPISSSINPDVLNIDERYQRKIGVCVACAVTTYVEYLYYVKTGTYTKLSVAFCYQVIKKFVDKNTTEGSSLRSGITVAMKYGICKESTMLTNYNLTHEQFLAQQIPEGAFTEALNYRIGGYFAVPIEQSLLAGTLYKYNLILTRYEVGNKWYSPSWLPKDIFPLVSSNPVASGHAVVQHAYNLKDKPRFDFLNWWSGNWGNRGTGWSYIDDYAPTEAFVLTLESQAHLLVDNSPLIDESFISKIMKILRALKITY